MIKIADTPGMCPNCKSMNVAYLDKGHYNRNDGTVIFEVQCEDCRTKYLETNTVEFLKSEWTSL